MLFTALQIFNVFHYVGELLCYVEELSISCAAAVNLFEVTLYNLSVEKLAVAFSTNLTNSLRVRIVKTVDIFALIMFNVLRVLPLLVNAIFANSVCAKIANYELRFRFELNFLAKVAIG